MRIGILSTYPPTRCGLATFTHALERALTETGRDDVVIVRSLDGPGGYGGPASPGRRMPRTELIAGDRASMRRAVAALDACDVVIVQHEYGIYGGPDGEEVVELLAMLQTPVMAVLHTVLPSPSAHQRAVLESVCAHAASVVVMTGLARDVLTSRYRVAPGKVVVIPHGVAARQPSAAPAVRSGRRRILTWGLLSPGKGIEWGIRAVGRLRDLDVEYVIAGQTHPKVRAVHGEAYREHLRQVIRELGLDSTVTLDDRYLDDRELGELIASADVVLLPYESSEQATSGVLAEAVAGRVPVVSTGFPHAVELLSGGAGIIAARADPVSMARALRALLEADDDARRDREAAAADTAPVTWAAAANDFRLLARSVMAERAA
jgi:glycosyltransferase involved in cell wall biosynthesis